MTESANPYVGPRALLEDEKLFGRDDEICRLQDLVMAERIVLVYSPSGAGKTSLVQSAVIPRLRDEGFDVVPGIRVNAGVPAGELPPKFNRYAYSVMDSIERTRTRVPRVTDFAGTTLVEYFEQHFPKVDALQGKQLTLFHFDQFEEVVSADPTDDAAKRDFFRDLGMVLRDRRFWAIFAMREEMLAAVGAFASFLPTRFQARFRLDFLAPAAAEQAIRLPALAHGVQFNVAPQLVRDLSRMRVPRPNGTMEMVEGPWVEPVQLQVVCRSLWTKPRRNPKEISESDRLGEVDVDSALAEYYDECVARAAEKAEWKERQVRDWIGVHLITSRGVRAQVLRDDDVSMGIPHAALVSLSHDHVVRSEERRNLVWYELAHDRLVEPIRASNLLFAKDKLNPLQAQAREWNARGRKAQYLLHDLDLIVAQQWAEENDAELTQIERDYVTESLAGLSELERRVFAWETANRDPSKLSRGRELQSLLLMNRSRRLTPSEQAFLSSCKEGARQERRERVGGLLIAGLTAVVAGLLVWGVVEERIDKSLKLRNRKKEVALQALLPPTVLAHTYAVDPTDTAAQPLGEIVRAQQQISAITKKADELPATGVEYFLKPRDKSTFTDALDSLGFQVAEMIDDGAIPTNCLWYGSGVSEEHVRLVAYAAIRSGIGLQAVQPMDTSDDLIQVWANPKFSDQPLLTVEEVTTRGLAALERVEAVEELEQSGVVRWFSPEQGTGTLTAKDGSQVFFRTDGERRARFRRGDRVAYDLYTGRRKYAMNVRIIVPAARRPE